jgi:apolipoprotein N-acyltransferase
MSRMRGFWQQVTGRPRLCALALGFLSATGFQPLGLWLLALAAMAGFVALIAAAPTRNALRGSAGCSASRTSPSRTTGSPRRSPPGRDARALGWAAVPLLSLYSRGLSALAALGARAIVGGKSSAGRSRSRSPAAGPASELLRATVFTGYAWNPFAMVLLGPFDRPGLAALAPWVGTYALSGWPCWLPVRWRVLAARTARGSGAAGRRRCSPAACIFRAPPARYGTLRFTLVQPDLAQDRLTDARITTSQFRPPGRARAAAGGRRDDGWCCGPNPASPTTCGRATRSATTTT